MAKLMKGRGDIESLAVKIERAVERSGISSKMVYKQKRRLSGVKMIVMVFEKFFARNNASTSLTVVLTADGNEVICDVVAAGGEGGILFAGSGSEKEYEKEVVDLLEEEGFR